MCGVAFRGSREPTPGIWGVLEEFLRLLEEFLRVQSEMGGLRVWSFRNRLHVLNQPVRRLVPQGSIIYSPKS